MFSCGRKSSSKRKLSKYFHEKKKKKNGLADAEQHANSNPEYLHQVANGPALDRRLEIAPATCMTLQNARHEWKATCV